MNGWWDPFLRWVGFAVCHQLPERTIHFGQRPLFLCARDTGLYAGFGICLLAAVLPYRRSRGGGPSSPWKAAMALSLLFLAADGVTVVLGWRESNNPLRFSSGMAAGSSLALLLGPAVNRLAWKAPHESRLMEGLAPAFRLAGGLAGASALYLAHPAPLLLPAQLILLACFVLTLLYLNGSAVAALLRSLGGKADQRMRLLAASAAPPMVAAEVALLHFLHSTLIR